ncbi:hypothetical protein OPV22_003117 [Ensete ventricosum]|uniref:At2g35280-like TPR domain-containing protein n=1 Tax=Ensete ventricosum TaxID=4639 RepID=A0AAV8RZW4_ENSVE|nr:hypothetical protein OPV22_003117 [Ensete ventricosum]
MTTMATDIDSLPQDLLVELCVSIVSSSPTPREDIMRLRASCRRFREASKARKVGQCMPVRRERAFRWLDAKGYIAFLHSCAECGNLEASLILGLDEVYNRKRKSLGLHHLHKAMKGGHRVAAYTLGIILFQDLQTQQLGVKTLNKLVAMDLPGGPSAHESLISGDVIIATCRREAASAMRDITWMRLHLRPRGPCTNRLCGIVENPDKADPWSGEESFRFCSQLCRWTHELYKFSKLT